MIELEKHLEIFIKMPQENILRFCWHNYDCNLEREPLKNFSEKYYFMVSPLAGWQLQKRDLYRDTGTLKSFAHGERQS